MKRVVFALCLLGGVVFLLPAQTVVVEYLEGRVEVERTSGWESVSIGDDIAADGRLRIGRGGFAQLNDGANTITLARPGTYDLHSIVDTTRRNRSAGVGSLLFDRVKKIAGRTMEEESETTAGGVRASEAATGPEIAWAGAESAADLIADGIARLNEGSYTDAYYLFDEAYAVADPGDVDEALFYLGYAANLTGRTREALRYLEQAELDPATDYYDDHVLTLAHVLVESFAYGDAISLLDRYLDASPTPADRQTALLLSGVAHRGVGNPGQARSFLTKARSIDASSTAGQTAESLLQQM